MGAWASKFAPRLAEKFPAKLITVDYDKDNRPIKIVAIGPEAARLQSAVSDNAQTDVADEVNLVLA